MLQNFLTAYRITKQASTKYSPYELLFAREPVLPGELQRAYQHHLDFDADTPGHLEALTADLLERAGRLATATPLCLANLQVAQHRDTLRYALTRSGTYLPRLREFQVGDLVYVIKQNHGPTQPGTHDDILQIMGFRDSGVAMCEGADAKTINLNVTVTFTDGQWQCYFFRLFWVIFLLRFLKKKRLTARVLRRGTDPKQVPAIANGGSRM